MIEVLFDIYFWPILLSPLLLIPAIGYSIMATGKTRRIALVALVICTLLFLLLLYFLFSGID